MVVPAAVAAGTISDRSGRRRRLVAVSGLVMAITVLGSVFVLRIRSVP